MKNREEKKGILARMSQSMDEQRPGRVGPIGEVQIREAAQTLQEYKEGKAALESRIIENERWYKLRHWEQIQDKSKNPNDPQPTSAWLLNSIANKHADAMDNFPEPIVLPREASDKTDAETLTSVLPVVLEQNDFEQTYSDIWWYKLKTGTGVTGVFWESTKNNGLGDIDIRQIDLLNLFWEPGVKDLQKSQNVFHVDLVDRKVLQAQYPFLTKLAGNGMNVAEYIHDEKVNTDKKCAVVDWYYKVNDGTKTVLHICKFVNDEIIYASENDPEYAERGFYDHGLYPFDMDVLFKEEGTPVGFGYIDVCKSPQIYIDKLDQVLLKHAVMGSRPRFFAKEGAVNEGEYADWTKDFVHYTGSGDPRDNMLPIEIPPISASYLQVRDSKIEELKETSGNRDFSQGGTSSGVTAASAIAALQEAGSKLSRDMIKSSYRSFARVNRLVIELIRQFYTEERMFRIIGPNGQPEFVRFSGAQISAKVQTGAFGGDVVYRVPIFDVTVKSQKASPFSTVAQNERAKELYAMGFFRPDLAEQALAALDMMDFEGIERVRDKISKNGMMARQIAAMQQQMLKMAQIIDSFTGQGITESMSSEFASGEAGTSPVSAEAVGGELQTNALGADAGKATSGTAGEARKRAAASSGVR